MDYKNIKIIKSKKRKTIALQVTSDAIIIVRVPDKLSLEKIKEIIEEKKQWLLEKYQLAISRLQKNPHKKYINGEGFQYLGNSYKLKIIKRQEEPLKFESGFILNENEKKNASKHFENWYKIHALEKIQNRVNYYAKLSGIEFGKISISTAKKRWGSCGAKGKLNFNWRLILAPLSIIDYVVVHELAHIEYKNHSRAFWNRVKTMYPRWKEAREWLRENGRSLSI